MFLLTINLVLVAIGLLFMYVIGKKSVITRTDQFTKYDLGKVFLWIGVVFAIVCMFINFSNYSSQVSSFEQARKVIHKTKILQSRYDSLYKCFNLHLAQQYPDIEKEILSKFGGASMPNLRIILTNYPTLQSSTTLIKLVDETKLIADDMYHKKLEAEEIYEVIRYREENPWILLKRSVPEDIYDYVYQKN